LFISPFLVPLFFNIYIRIYSLYRGYSEWQFWLDLYIVCIYNVT
jgi:hypothetical protein